MAGVFPSVSNKPQATCCAFSKVPSIRLYIGWSAGLLIKAQWGISDNNRRAKYYELTKTGRRQLELETDSWNKLTAAMAQVLGTA